MAYPRVASLKTLEQFSSRLNALDISIPCDRPDESSFPSLAMPAQTDGFAIGNRFCILPMEGWDGTQAGQPTDLTRRRWRQFGSSGAKLIWGGEAVAIRHDGRANPNQLLMNEGNLPGIANLRELLVEEHLDRFSTTDDLLVGLQLTHSGRFAKPNSNALAEPMIGRRNPVLDRRLGIVDDGPLLSDDDLKRLVDDFVAAAVLAQQAGFSFVDIKHCHGYLGHELLSGFDRPGEYGGSFKNRTRFLQEIVAGVRAMAPRLKLAVRVSIYDFLPFRSGTDGVGIPEQIRDFSAPFGADPTGLAVDLNGPCQLMELFEALRISLVCTTAGSPYYNPHIQRPATFPPSDGYQPPEDPLIGVARQINTTAELKRRYPNLFMVGSGYSYLQDWLPHVAEAVVRTGMADSIGLGRMVLSYPELPRDVLGGRGMARKKICRTFSDCTTAPRHGMVSGCYPLDPFYKSRPEWTELKTVKKQG